MRRAIIAVAVLFAAVSASFAGVRIDITGTDTDGNTQNVTVRWEGRQIKITTVKGAIMVKDSNLYLVDAASKTYMTLPYDTNSAGQMSGQKNPDVRGFRSWPRDFFKTAVFTKTGVTKTFAGYACDEYKVVYNGETAYLYYTKDAALKASMNQFVASARDLADMVPYSLQLEQYGVLLGVMEDGKMTIEITAVKFQTIPASEFSLDGYSEMQMFNMQGGH